MTPGGWGGCPALRKPRPALRFSSPVFPHYFFQFTFCAAVILRAPPFPEGGCLCAFSPGRSSSSHIQPPRPHVAFAPRGSEGGYRAKLWAGQQSEQCMLGIHVQTGSGCQDVLRWGGGVEGGICTELSVTCRHFHYHSLDTAVHRR